MKLLKTVAALSLATVATTGMAQDMSFFVTSVNPNGGNLGGLAGADGYCEGLAATVGAGGKTWRAYLSTDTVDARDRIGTGPWYNVNGVMIARNLDELHGDAPGLTSETALDQNGNSPNYIGADGNVAQPLQHDMLTGTNADGTAAPQTCNNWTDGSADSSAMLGHADRRGRDPVVNSWNAVHPSQGCSLETLAPTGGAGQFYCFAID
jgi:hypothetical protein